MPDPIVVVLAADSRFAKQLAVTIASISRSGAGRTQKIFVLHDGYEPGLVHLIEEVAADEVELCWLDGRCGATDRAHISDNLPPASLFRLRIEDLMPEEVERVIYLDTDIMVRHSLGEVWDSGLRGTLVGAVRDAFLPWAGSALPWRQLGIPPDMPYFNSGVMLIPVARWRSERVGVRALDLLGRCKLSYGDQAALNIAIMGNWTSLGLRWNLQSNHLVGDTCPAWITEPHEAFEEALDDPAIVHLCRGGFDSPWQSSSRHPYRAEWFEYLDTTPWAGWRPKEPREPSLSSRVIGRVRRASRVLFKGK